VDQLPDSQFLPITQTPPAGHTGAAPYFLTKHFPGNAATHRAPGEDFRALFPVQPTTQLKLWRDARPQRSVTLSRHGDGNPEAGRGSVDA